MSDEQPQQHEQVQVAQSKKTELPKDAWGAPLDSIPSARQDELRALADRQREWATQDKPDLEQSVFKGVSLSGAEVFFLAAYTLAGPEGTRDGIEQIAAQLRKPAVVWVRISSNPVAFSTLFELRLEGADIRAAESSANLHNARLDGADFNSATLTGADLVGATLTGAMLPGARLNGASLAAVDLSGADLRLATLSGSDLRSTTLDGKTLLAGTVFAAS